MILSSFCSKEAAERLTGRRVTEVQEWANVVFVRFEKGSPRFMSKHDFHFDAMAERSSEAAECTVTPNDNWQTPSYWVTHKDDRHEVMLHNGQLRCDCADWQSQWEKQGREERTCKHTLAVRFHLNKPRKEASGATVLSFATVVQQFGID